jgi:predicted ArsR family transcriptional regulator
VNGRRQREALLAALGRAGDGLDVKQLAAELALHPNTVRWHLGVLEDEKLLEGRPARQHARGRPGVVYRLTGEGIAERDGAAQAYAAGVHWGRHLHEAEPERDVVALLDGHGFAASETDGRIEMRSCPFLALAEAAPQVICTLHRGFIDGALAAGGSARLVDRLEPFAEPGLCIAHLR